MADFVFPMPGSSPTPVKPPKPGPRLKPIPVVRGGKPVTAAEVTKEKKKKTDADEEITMSDVYSSLAQTPTAGLALLKAAPAGLGTFVKEVAMPTERISREEAEAAGRLSGTSLLRGIQGLPVVGLAFSDFGKEMMDSFISTGKSVVEATSLGYAPFTKDDPNSYRNTLARGESLLPKMVEDVGNLSIALHGVGSGLSAASRGAVAGSARGVGLASAGKSISRAAVVADKFGALPITLPFKAAGKVGRMGTQYGRNHANKLRAEADSYYRVDPNSATAKALYKRANAYERISGREIIGADGKKIIIEPGFVNRFAKRAVFNASKNNTAIISTMLGIVDNPLFKDEPNPNVPGENWGSLSDYEQQAVIATFTGRAQEIQRIAEITGLSVEDVAYLGRLDLEPGYSIVPEGARLAADFVNHTDANPTMSPQQYARLADAADRLRVTMGNFSDQARAGYGRAEPLPEAYDVPTPDPALLLAELEKAGSPLAEVMANAMADIPEVGSFRLSENPKDPTRIAFLKWVVENAPDAVALNESIYPPAMRGNIVFYKRVREALYAEGARMVGGTPPTDGSGAGSAPPKPGSFDPNSSLPTPESMTQPKEPGTLAKFPRQYIQNTMKQLDRLRGTQKRVATKLANIILKIADKERIGLQLQLKLQNNEARILLQREKVAKLTALYEKMKADQADSIVREGKIYTEEQLAAELEAENTALQSLDDDTVGLEAAADELIDELDALEDEAVATGEELDREGGDSLAIEKAVEADRAEFPESQVTIDLQEQLDALQEQYDIATADVEIATENIQRIEGELAALTPPIPEAGLTAGGGEPAITPESIRETIADSTGDLANLPPGRRAMILDLLENAPYVPPVAVKFVNAAIDKFLSNKGIGGLLATRGEQRGAIIIKAQEKMWYTNTYFITVLPEDSWFRKKIAELDDEEGVYYSQAKSSGELKSSKFDVTTGPNVGSVIKDAEKNTKKAPLAQIVSSDVRTIRDAPTPKNKKPKSYTQKRVLIKDANGVRIEIDADHLDVLLAPGRTMQIAVKKLESGKESKMLVVRENGKIVGVAMQLKDFLGPYTFADQARGVAELLEDSGLPKDRFNIDRTANAIYDATELGPDGWTVAEAKTTKAAPSVKPPTAAKLKKITKLENSLETNMALRDAALQEQLAAQQALNEARLGADAQQQQARLSPPEQTAAAVELDYSNGRPFESFIDPREAYLPSETTDGASVHDITVGKNYTRIQVKAYDPANKDMQGKTIFIFDNEKKGGFRLWVKKNAPIDEIINVLNEAKRKSQIPREWGGRSLYAEKDGAAGKSFNVNYGTDSPVSIVLDFANKDVTAGIQAFNDFYDAFMEHYVGKAVPEQTAPVAVPGTEPIIKAFPKFIEKYADRTDLPAQLMPQEKPIIGEVTMRQYGSSFQAHWDTFWQSSRAIVDEIYNGVKKPPSLKNPKTGEFPKWEIYFDKNITVQEAIAHLEKFKERLFNGKFKDRYNYKSKAGTFSVNDFERTKAEIQQTFMEFYDEFMADFAPENVTSKAPTEAAPSAGKLTPPESIGGVSPIEQVKEFASDLDAEEFNLQISKVGLGTRNVNALKITGGVGKNSWKIIIRDDATLQEIKEYVAYLRDDAIDDQPPNIAKIEDKFSDAGAWENEDFQMFAANFEEYFFDSEAPSATQAPPTALLSQVTDSVIAEAKQPGLSQIEQSVDPVADAANTPLQPAEGQLSAPVKTGDEALDSNNYQYENGLETFDTGVRKYGISSEDAGRTPVSKTTGRDRQKYRSVVRRIASDGAPIESTRRVFGTKAAARTYIATLAAEDAVFVPTVQPEGWVNIKPSRELGPGPSTMPKPPALLAAEAKLSKLEENNIKLKAGMDTKAAQIDELRIKEASERAKLLQITPEIATREALLGTQMITQPEVRAAGPDGQPTGRMFTAGETGAATVGQPPKPGQVPRMAGNPVGGVLRPIEQVVRREPLATTGPSEFATPADNAAMSLSPDDYSVPEATSIEAQADIVQAAANEALVMRGASMPPSIPLIVALAMGADEFGQMGPGYLPSGRPSGKTSPLTYETEQGATAGFLKLPSEYFKGGNAAEIYDFRILARRLSAEQLLMDSNETFRALMLTKIAVTPEQMIGEKRVQELYALAGQQALMLPASMPGGIEGGVAAYAEGIGGRDVLLARKTAEIFGRMLDAEMKIRGFETLPIKGDIRGNVRFDVIDGKRPYLPKYAREQVINRTSYINPDMAVEVLNKYLQATKKTTSIFKDFTLPLSVQWQIGDIIGIFVSAAATGVNPLVLVEEMNVAFKNNYGGGWRDAFKKEAERQVTQQGKKLSGSGLQDVGLRTEEKQRLSTTTPGSEPLSRVDKVPVLGKVKAGARWYKERAYMVNDAINRVGRQAYFMARLEQALGKLNKMHGTKYTVEDVTSLGLDKYNPRQSFSTVEEQLVHQDIAKAWEDTLDTANEVMGDWNDLSPWERKYVLPHATFYAWIKHINKLFLKIARENPKAIVWQMYLGQLAYDPDTDPLGLLAGNIKLPGAGITSTNFANPFADTADLIGGLTERGTTGAWSPDLSRVFGMASPMPRMLFAGATGLNLSSMTPLSRQSGEGVPNKFGSISANDLAFAVRHPGQFASYAAQQFPLIPKLMDIAPTTRLPLLGTQLGPYQRYDTGGPRLIPGRQDMTPKYGGRVAALARLLTIPGTPASQSEDAIRERERLAQERTRAYINAQKDR